MTEINQLARDEFAAKNGLYIKYQSDGYVVVAKGEELLFRAYHGQTPEQCSLAVLAYDEALDAVIWKGADKFVVKAYLSQSGVICFAFSKDNVNPGWKLIATRELPAEKPKDPDVIGGDTLIQPETPRLSHEMLDYAKDSQTRIEKGLKEQLEALLVADLKEFVSLSDKYINKTAVHQAHHYKEIGSRAKDLLERINPKPKRCSSQLPVDTLCEVWSVDRGTSWLRLTHKDGFSAFSSAINDSVPENHIEFKVLEQPQPTFWQGGECPVPDWLEIKVWLRKGKVITNTDASKLDWGKLHNPLNEIIAYQIMGEKND